MGIRKETLKNLPEGNRGSFSADPLDSPTLPSRYYTDNEIYQRELTHLHQKTWCYVGHISDVAEARSYFTDTVAHQPVVVIKGDDAVIRAFFNVCQHRGHELLKGRGKLGKGLSCPYHAWMYNLEGALVRAPYTEQLAGFDKSQYSLRTLPIAFAAGLIFVNLDPECDPFEAEMAEFGPSISKQIPDIEQYVAAYRLHYDINANWKTVVDNFSEAYHIPVAHPQLAKVLDQGMDEFQEEYRWSYILYRSRTGFEGLELEQGSPYIAWQAWPYLCMLSLPGSENLIVLRMAPNGVDRCAERVDIYTPQGEGENDKNLIAVKDLFINMFNQEDIAIVESVQRGMSSLGYDQGRYVCDAAESWFSETLLHGFHMQVLEALEE
jgi:choline monooxygenase